MTALEFFSGTLMVPESSYPTFRGANDGIDFFPDIPSSHAWHIFANAMNNIFTSHLNGLPDWDMFQSALPEYGALHAAARCISGGPIYITDTPGQHDVSLIKQMSAVSPQGNTIILRPSRVALPIDPFVAYNNNQLLKVGNFCGSVGGSSLMALFNVSETENSELISIDEFPGIVPNTKYVVRSHVTGGVSGAHVKGGGSFIPTTLAQHGWEFYNATPTQELVHADDTSSFSVGVFGLISAMSGAAAIISQSVNTETERAVVSVTLKALGTLGNPWILLRELVLTSNDTPNRLLYFQSCVARHLETSNYDIRKCHSTQHHQEMRKERRGLGSRRRFCLEAAGVVSRMVE